MRVLLVEGNDARAQVLSGFLRSEELIVDCVETGTDALDLLRHYSFDIVLLDLVLPDMDGTTLIARIRSAGHHTPVLALTNVFISKQRLAALSAGADNVVDYNSNWAELLAPDTCHPAAIERH